MASIAERRLAAILAADVVGYSRLVEADEARTIGDLKIIRQDILAPLLTENRGRIVKLMGDGVIVEFSSVVAAVTCAIAIFTRGSMRCLRTAMPKCRTSSRFAR